MKKNDLLLIYFSNQHIFKCYTTQSHKIFEVTSSFDQQKLTPYQSLSLIIPPMKKIQWDCIWPIHTNNMEISACLHSSSLLKIKA
jgi:hypothetical protein